MRLANEEPFVNLLQVSVATVCAHWESTGTSKGTSVKSLREQAVHLFSQILVFGQRGRAGLVPGVSSLALSQPLWVQVFYLEVIFRWKQEAACKCETSLTNPFGLEEVLK